jgi:CTP:molybdopterin cytidylyltransferase MocA
MNGEPGDRVAGVILAAGRSIRMGRAKAFLPVPGGGTFLERLVRTFELAGASPVVVVRPPQWADGPAPGSGNVEFAINPEPGRGQLSSLQCGLAAVPPDIPAVLFTPVDVPLVTVETVSALMDRRRSTRAAVVRPARAGRHGHPVLVSRAVADALLCADPSESARNVLQRFSAATVDVLVEDEGAFLDIDTPDDYDRLLARWSADSGRLVGPS